MNENEIIDMYLNQNMSPYVIAEKYNTYANKIRRILIKRGIKIDSKSEAQKKCLASGRSPHPTAGKKRSTETKEKISEGVYKNWQGLSEEEHQKRVDKAREQWNNMTVDEQEGMRRSAALAVRQASKEGSKMENFLNEELKKAGYSVLFHKKGLIASDELEIDLFIPELNTAIEVDGPSHFYPMWGKTDVERETILQKHINADAHKSGLLLAKGFVVIRIKHLTKHLSAKHKRGILVDLLSLLDNIRSSFPEKTKRYLELEVK
jgi:very-short-patch-repair endonuclease